MTKIAIGSVSFPKRRNNALHLHGLLHTVRLRLVGYWLAHAATIEAVWSSLKLAQSLRFVARLLGKRDISVPSSSVSPWWSYLIPYARQLLRQSTALSLWRGRFKSAQSRDNRQSLHTVCYNVDSYCVPNSPAREPNLASSSSVFSMSSSSGSVPKTNSTPPSLLSGCTTRNRKILLPR